MPQIKITLILDVPDGMVPTVDYEEVPPEPPHLMTPPPQVYDRDEIAHPVVVQAAPVPQCPMHGAMTFHQTKKDGTPMPRYSCDTRMPNGSFCPTKMVRVAA